VGDHAEVDPQFEAMLLKSLSREPDDRFQTAREFGDALASYLFHHQMKVTSYDIANLVKAALERQKSVPPQPMMIDGMIQEELGRFTSLDSTVNLPADPSKPFRLSPDDEGARPLVASDFVDPSNWFAGDSEVETAIENVRSSAPPGATMGWFESKDSRPAAQRRAGVPMGPSLMPAPRTTDKDGAPVMTFRPPGATPISIANPDSQTPAQEEQRKQKSEAAPAVRPGSSKVALIVAGVVALAALGVALGWFLTK
jgi:hypothetical protein